jgi:hypothetical protein
MRLFRSVTTAISAPEKMPFSAMSARMIASSVRMAASYSGGT